MGSRDDRWIMDRWGILNLLYRVSLECNEDEIKMMGMEYFLPLDEGGNPGKELQ